jgi:hypothetical protein
MKATKITQGSLGVQIMDPYQMVELRHRILLALQKQQEQVINPFIKQFLHEKSPKMPLVEFGVKQLRCWLDLMIRFINIPMRIQATKELHLGFPFRKTDASEHHVARLLFENGVFTRLFMFDKVGKTGAHRPIRCPLPQVIVPYLEFYIKYCRVGDSSLVFVNATGSPWKQASRDIKNYLQDTLEIPADALDPSGRFVHGSRSIMLANYALRCKFDPLRLQQFATLMRHSFATMNSYYLLWTDWATAKMAMSDFNQAFGLPEPTPITTTQDFSQFDVTFHPLLQNGPESKEEEGELKKDRCEKCRGELRIFGPYGKKKHAKQYGCYWYQCATCVPATRKWIPLGFLTEYSCSRKSKNHDAIINYIKTSIA